MSGAGKHANFKDLSIGVLPFILVDLITLALLIAFPALSLWIPEAMIQR
jgi:TRAP-type C4-dicarboxylate transport system permease large subunit